MTDYPKAVKPNKIGTYSPITYSGGGWFYDEVLEYRVWGRDGDGQVGFVPFATYEEAEQFANENPECESPLVLVRQKEWIREGDDGTMTVEVAIKDHLTGKMGPRITEWRPEWLADSKRVNRKTLTDFIASKVKA